MESILAFVAICLSCFVLTHAQNHTIPVRLYGSDGTQGVIEVYVTLNNRLRWSTLCDDGWNIKAAAVVCRQLNLGLPLSISFNLNSRYYYYLYGIENVTCFGNESNIGQCNFTTYHDCNGSEAAGVVCSSIKVRLTGGVQKTWKNRTRDGLVEIMHNGKWGTICDIGFDKPDADVICRQLGFPGAKRIVPAGEYGTGNASMPIHFSNMQCSGLESDVYQCRWDDEPIGCTHSNDVLLECLPQVQLSNGDTFYGITNVWYQGVWLEISEYDSATTGAITCKELGFDDVSLTVRRGVPGYNYKLSFYCKGTEDTLLDCRYRISTSYYSAEHKCQHLRMNGGVNESGLLEFSGADGWYPFCFTELFDRYVADVTCRQFGYPFATNFTSVSLPSNRYGIRIIRSTCQGTNNHNYLFNCVEYINITCQNAIFLTCHNNAAVRLVGGPGVHMGRVEVFDRNSSQWGTVCYDDLYYYHRETMANFVCASLGHRGYRYSGRANFSSVSPSSNSPIINGRIYCYSSSYTAAYLNLYQCSRFESRLQVNVTRCTSDQEWILECQPNVELFGYRSNRPVSGFSGTVYYRNPRTNIRYYICDDGWDLNDAKVVCRMLGFPGALDSTVRSQYGNIYGQDGPAFSNFQCNGSENHILDCRYSSIATCSSSRSAGVRCLSIRLADGLNQHSGRVEVYSIYHSSDGLYQIAGQQWGTMCEYYGNWTIEDAGVVCRSLGYRFTGNSSQALTSYGPGTGPIWINSINCTNVDYDAWECLNRRNYGQYYSSPPLCNHSMDIGVNCAAPLPVRLQDSAYHSTGRLEVWMNNVWGSVCNVNFTLQAANVVCRQLGFERALDITPGGYFGQSTGPIHMENVMCNGDEASISECAFSTTQSCDHSQDVGVFCQDIRLSNGSNTAEGILEINENYVWGAVCSSYYSFSNIAAAVACSQLQLGKPVLHNRMSRIFNPPHYFVRSSFCRGNNERLSQCIDSYHTRTYSIRSCYTTFLKCSDLRLRDGDVSFSGRVEVLYNGEWGTVCSNGFDKVDAAVVCRQAGYGPPSRYWIDPSHRRHGRIWLDNLHCLGTENTLFDCSYANLGETDCSHNQDIFVECTDFCDQSIEPANFSTITYDATPSYTNSTATFSCIEGYVLAEAGSAICDRNGNWIVKYPKCAVPIQLVDESGNERAVFGSGGVDMSRGRVEVLFKGRWHTICSQGFGFKEANVICNQLGFNGAHRVRNGYYGEGFGDNIAMKDRGCDGGETNILDCDLQQLTTSDLQCSHADDVGIECVDVRLLPLDSRSHSGRIEVLYNNEWGQVCFQGNTALSLVACSQIGYGSVDTVSFSTNLPFDSPIWLSDDLNCTGNEETLFDCLSSYGIFLGKEVYTGCSDGAAGVTCPLSVCRPFLPPNNGYYVNDIQKVYFYPVNLLQISCRKGFDLISLESENSSGTAECQRDGSWNDTFFCEKIIYLKYGFKISAGNVEVFDKYQRNYKAVCDRNWDLNDANVVCYQLGFPGAMRATTRSYFTYRNNSAPAKQIPTPFNNVDCTGSEETIYDCLDIFGNTLFTFAVELCPSQSTAGVICNENIRLTGGSSLYEGQVEVFVNGQWGTVCSDGIGTNEVDTLCQSLGFGPSQSVVRHVESLDSPIAISDLRCSNNLNHFTKCAFSDQLPLSCFNNSILHLNCSPAVRFVEDGVRSPWEGEIEVYYAGQWDRICNNDWDLNDATVVCRELGFTTATATEYSRSTHAIHATAILDGALCTGNEFHLLDCPRAVPLSDVSVDCLGNYAGVSCMTECQTLSPPEYGQIVGSTGNRINDTISFECLENFILIGSAMRVCLPSGQWSGILTQCVAECETLSAPEDGRIVRNTGNRSHDIIVIACSENFALVGSAWRTCQLNGQWSGVSPVCVAECSSLLPPENGQIIGITGNGTNSSITFGCFANFVLTGSPTRTCGANGEWSGVPTQCIADDECQTLLPPENGRIVMITGNRINDNITFECFESSILVGSAKRTCQPNGQWSGISTQCIIVECQILLPPENGHIVMITGNRTNDNVTFECFENFILQGSAKRTCQPNGQWSGIFVQCLVECQTLLPPENGRIVMTTGNRTNDNITFECFENFTLSGSAKRTCQPNGQWSGVIAQCLGIRLTDGSNKAQGRVEVYYRGQWGSVCDEGWDIYDGQVVCRQLGYQQVISITNMATNFGPGVGPIQIQNVACRGTESNLFMCPLPSGIGSPSTCLHDHDAGVICADCPVLQSPENGLSNVVLDNPLNGDSVSFSCNDGYNLIGSAERTCMPAGAWSGDPVTCQATCAIEDAVKNERVQFEPIKRQYVQDDEVVIACDSSYQLTGGTNTFIVRVCLSNKSWTGVDPKCERIPGLTTTDSQGSSREVVTSSSPVVYVLIATVGLIVICVIVAIVVVYLKKRKVIAQTGRGYNNTTYRNAAVANTTINPIFGIDENN